MRAIKIIILVFIGLTVTSVIFFAIQGTPYLVHALAGIGEGYLVYGIAGLFFGNAKKIPFGIAGVAMFIVNALLIHYF